MPFGILCQHCDAEFTMPDSAEGKKSKCTKCGERFIVARRVVPATWQGAPPLPAKSEGKEAIAALKKQSIFRNKWLWSCLAGALLAFFAFARGPYDPPIAGSIAARQQFFQKIQLELPVDEYDQGWMPINADVFEHTSGVQVYFMESLWQLFMNRGPSEMWIVYDASDKPQVEMVEATLALISFIGGEDNVGENERRIRSWMNSGIFDLTTVKQPVNWMLLGSKQICELVGAKLDSDPSPGTTIYIKVIEG